MTDRGRAWRWTALVLGTITVVMATFVPIPYVSKAPGPVFDVLGEYEGEPVVTISGTKQYPTTGSLYMTTVSESGGGAGEVTVGTALIGLFSPDTSVSPDPEAGRAGDDTDLQRAVFDASSSRAVGAAASYLDRPVKSQPIVIEVVAGTAAAGVLKPGDLIDRVGGRPVTTSEQVGTMVRSSPVGTTFRMRITRDGEPQEVSVTSRPAADNASIPAIGVMLDDHFTSDFDAEVTLTQIGGPSAGLMLAVAMVDKLTPDDLLRGHDVAGTGTITGEGEVGPIGGIDKKMIAAQDAGAQLFIAPRANCEDVVSSTPAGLQVAAVSSLSQTVEVLRNWRAGRPVPGCPADAAPSGTG